MVDSPLEHPFPCEIKHRITKNEIERAGQDSKCSPDHLPLCMESIKTREN